MAIAARKRLALHLAQEALPLSAPFVITGYTFTEVQVIVARLDDGDAIGEGEAAGVYYLNDDAAHMLATAEAVRNELAMGADRDDLRRLLPPGGARNALDCALWDLEAKHTRQPAWKIAGLEKPRPLVTTFTLGAGEPGVMAGKALGFAQARALKLKLTGQPALDAERVRAVRKARPDVWLGVDGNQGFVPDSLEEVMPALVAAEVRLLEQPFARGSESQHDGLKSPIPVAADESVQGIADVEALVGRFDVVNIKLDKCGGLTEALAMAAEARRLKLGVMVGNMVGSSLAMAPAWLLGQVCDIADLDGTIFITRDRSPSMVFEDGRVSYPDRGWGNPA
jgi:L-alanine-DL-glutamate epimerase-like enolase superfamily enzyme